MYVDLVVVGEELLLKLEIYFSPLILHPSKLYMIVLKEAESEEKKTIKREENNKKSSDSELNLK